MANKLYLMPGLGLSDQVFKYVNLASYDLVKMYWIEPITNESLALYVERLIQFFKISNADRNVLLGHSFGGIIVQEIAKKINYQHIFLISSIRSGNELPDKLSVLRKIKLHRILKKWHLKYSFPLWKNFHDYSSKEKKELFYSSIDLYSEQYFRWSLDRLVEWEGNYNLDSLTQIHGVADATFPIKLIMNAIAIKGGSHLMLLSQYEEINQIIKRKLDE